MSRLVDEHLGTIQKEINKANEKHPDWFSNDNILDEITNIFDKSVGSPYSDEELRKIYDEGEKRYQQKIPPGYKDTNKDCNDNSQTKKYGDLLLWYQIIDKAKETKKPIIFVTDDRKEDWWWVVRGNTVGPRHELIKEIYSKAGVAFHMYTADTFLKFAADYFNHPMEDKTISEVKKIASTETKYITDYLPFNQSDIQKQLSIIHSLQGDIKTQIREYEIGRDQMIEQKSYKDENNLARIEYLEESICSLKENYGILEKVRLDLLKKLKAVS